MRDRSLPYFSTLTSKRPTWSTYTFVFEGVENAERFLDKYRDTHAVFNDDVQGTGAVTLAALMAATGVTKTKLSEQRIVVYGAGELFLLRVLL